MTDPQGCVPTFQVNLRHDTGPQPYIVSVPIIHPDVAGFRGIVRRLASKQEYSTYSMPQELISRATPTLWPRSMAARTAASM
jgi:hypothetical protein